MSQNHRRKFKLIHLFLIVLAGYFCINIYHWWIFSLDFDKDAWLEGIHDTKGTTVRKRMIKDIRSRLLLVGTEKAKVIDALGNPDTKEYFRGHDLVYWIGPDSSYLDSEWLVIDFDENDKLVSRTIMTD